MFQQGGDCIGSVTLPLPGRIGYPDFQLRFAAAPSDVVQLDLTYYFAFEQDLVKHTAAAGRFQPQLDLIPHDLRHSPNSLNFRISSATSLRLKEILLS